MHEGTHELTKFFPTEGQAVSILGFAGYAVSVATNPLGHLA